MSYNAKNYTEQGGNKTIIGGELEIKAGATLKLEEGAEVEGLPSGGTKLYRHNLTVGSVPNTKYLTLILNTPTEVTKKGTELINFLNLQTNPNLVAKSFQGSPIFHFTYRGTNNMTCYFFWVNDSGEAVIDSVSFDTNSYVDNVTEL